MMRGVKDRGPRKIKRRVKEKAKGVKEEEEREMRE